MTGKPRWFPGSLRARGIVLIVLTALVAIAPTVWIWQAAAARESSRHMAAAQALLAVALNEFLANDDTHHELHAEWITALATEETRVHWAQVFDRDGHGFEFRRRTSLANQDIVDQIDFDARTPRYQPLKFGPRQSERYYLLTIPQSDGRMLAAVLDLQGRLSTMNEVAMLAAVGVGLFGLLLCIGFFRHAILIPVRNVVRQAADIHEELSLSALQAGVPDELSDLVGQAETMQRELKQWRVEATYLRNAFEQELQSKTKTVERALTEAEEQADTDMLTRLRNRRALQRELPLLFAKARTEDDELTVVLIDINNFKVFNDTLGHQAGDSLLSFVGELIRSSIRKHTDLAVRFGGDEFVVVLPGTRPADAVHAFERLAAMFGQKLRTFEKTDPPAGFSAGVASYQKHHPQSPEALLRLADEAMYLAKRSGKPVATVDDLDAARYATPATQSSPPRTKKPD